MSPAGIDLALGKPQPKDKRAVKEALFLLEMAAEGINGSIREIENELKGRDHMYHVRIRNAAAARDALARKRRRGR